MKHDDDTGAWGTYAEYEDDEVTAALCLLLIAVGLVGFGFFAGWVVFA